jgi:hypothetical protein
VRAIYWIFENESYLTTDTATGNKLLSYEAVGGGDTFNKFKLQLNGNDRFEERNANYFRLVQSIEHSISAPRKHIYMYSFASDTNTTQPSGHINGSMFNKTLLRLTLQDPPFINSSLTTNVCVTKSSVFNQRPNVVRNIGAYNPEQVVQVEFDEQFKQFGKVALQNRQDPLLSA